VTDPEDSTTTGAGSRGGWGSKEKRRGSEAGRSKFAKSGQSTAAPDPERASRGADEDGSPLGRGSAAGGISGFDRSGAVSRLGLDPEPKPKPRPSLSVSGSGGIWGAWA